MNDRQYAEQKRRVERFHDKWRSVLGLSDWRATLTFSRDSSEMEPMLIPGMAPSMEIDVAWQYQSYNIKVVVLTLPDVDDVELEERVLHELVHVLVEHLADLMVDRAKDQPTVEETTTRLTNAIARAYAAGVVSE